MTDHYYLGEYSRLVADAAAKLDTADVPARLLNHDHTLWSDRPTEISNRLAWLTIGPAMRPEIADLRRFADAVRDDGYQHVVLLGMGGSSLGPEVIRRVIGPNFTGSNSGGSNSSGPNGQDAGYPRMLTLDSTVPDWVASTTAAIDPARTLFIVSSKSGTTTEPLAFYAHYRGLAESAVGAAEAGSHFAAVTDPGTPLAALGDSDGFRRVFLNNPDIGGRYSVLSHFGLVPAALIGVDLGRLLDAVQRMQAACLAGGGSSDNPGTWLGAAIGGLARHGRDKLTLLASDGIAPFGLWVEQLLAESLGKNGAGVIPVASEPVPEPSAADCYGDDRFFVQLRLATEDNAALDDTVRSLRSAGHPVAVLEMDDAYDLGAEFYRWEYATAVAGHILGIHPFDQPDVQGAKDRTVEILDLWGRNGALSEPGPDTASALLEHLASSRPGDYLAIMAYLPDTPEIAAALHDLRRRVMAARRIATTMGYGPRFLHSTGQLHKGGPNSGIFLQLTQDHQSDIPIPGWDFGFGVLADAQAQGDHQALRGMGRRAVSLHLGTDPVAGIRSIAEQV